jgi:polygalacturonase
MDAAIADIVNAIQQPRIPDRTINLIEFSGHRPDRQGTYNFQPDIQRAINALAAQGGGTLYFPHTQGPDTWAKLTEVFRCVGPIQFKSHIQLAFDMSTRLFFEYDATAYFPEGKGVISRYEGTTFIGVCPLIRAFNVTDAAITVRKGFGAMPVIDGDGQTWYRIQTEKNNAIKEAGGLPSYQAVRAANHAAVPLRERRYDNPDNHFLRPCMMEFFLCKNILVEGVQITDSPLWCIHPVFSESMIFRNIIFDSQNVNNDGFDPESSRNVLIENIIFNNHDDNVALKSGRDREGRDGVDVTGTELETISSRYNKNSIFGGPTENVVVRNCIFKGHYAVCAGSEMSGGVRNIYVVDSIAPQDVKMTFFLKSGRERGGFVENVYLHNIRVNDSGTDAICLIPNYDNDTQSPYPPKFKNIYVEDLTVETVENAVRIMAWPDKTIDNIFIRNVVIKKAREPFAVNHVKNVRLDGVMINGENYDGTYNKSDPSIPTPRQN